MARLLHKLGIVGSVLLGLLVTLGFILRHPERVIGNRLKRRASLASIVSAASIRSILVVKVDGLGDLVLATPLLRALRDTFSEARFVYVVDEWLAESVARLGLADEVIGFNWRAPAPAAAARAAKLAAARLTRGFDLAVVPRWETDLSHASLLAFLSDAAYRVGFSRKVFAKKRMFNLFSDLLYSHVVSTPPETHEVEKNIALGNALGLRAISTELFFRGEALPSDTEELASARRHGRPDGPLIALGIGAMGPNRKWPIAGYVDVAAWIRSSYPGSRVLLIGGAGDRKSAETIRNGVGEDQAVVDLTGRLSVNQSFELLRRCDLFVGNDSGPKHLAAAAKIPIVEISSFPLGGDPAHYSASNRFGAWGEGVILLRPEKALPPCSGACVIYEPHCITTIAPDRVIAAIAKVLSEVAV